MAAGASDNDVGITIPGEPDWNKVEAEWKKIQDTKTWATKYENKKYVYKKGMETALSISGKKTVLLRNLEFDFNGEPKLDSQGKELETTMLALTNCQYVLIDNCRFHGKRARGVGLKIAGGGTKYIVVRNSEWFDFTFGDSNGGEPTRVGNSHSSGCWFHVLFENCYFHDLASDPETVSLKSCGNTVRFCHTKNNKSHLTVRHGGFNRIQNNNCEGSGGIRFYGYGNIITDNVSTNNNSEKYPFIVVGAGDVVVDPNFTAVDKPSGKDIGKSHHNYAQVNHCVVKGNTYKDCEVLLLNRTDQPLKPVESTIEKPKEVTVIPPPPPPPPPPPDPEPEPVPDESGIACVICKEEPAIKKLSINVGEKHYASVKQGMVDLIKNLRTAAEGGETT